MGAVRVRDVVTVVSLAVLVSACASARVDNVRDYAAGERLPRPPAVLVSDFDVGGPNTPSFEAGRQAANAMADELVQRITALGIPARRASSSTGASLDTLMITGQFVTVDEGDMLARTIIGFGVGSSDVRVRFRALQQTASGPRTLGVGEVSATGSRQPGIAGPAVIAGATGQVAGLVVGGVTHGAAEMKGGVDADARRAAGEISEVLEYHFREQGWI